MPKFVRILFPIVVALCAGCAVGLMAEGQVDGPRVGDPNMEPVADAGRATPADVGAAMAPPVQPPAIRPDAGAGPMPPPVGPPPARPREIQYVAIASIASPSWVAWGEVEIYANGRNIALGQRASASHAEEYTPPARAVDGDPITPWNAGAFPPVAFEIDLGAERRIERVRLRVVQSPAGQTTHALRVAGADGQFEEMHRWIQYTREGDWLEFEFPGAMDGPEDPDPEVADPGGDDDLGRGLRWVRENPMFISGLSVQMPSPDAAYVSTYLDEFGANAVHLWVTGLPHRMDGWREGGGADTRFVAWLLDDGTSADGGALVGGYPGDVPGRIGYQVGDEPRTLEDLEEIEAGLDAVRAHDPDALLYVNFSFHAERLQDLFDHYATMDADVVSYDTYTARRSLYERAALFRAAGLRMGRPYWCYLGAYADIGQDPHRHPSTVRWSAFAHALFGYTGYTWFTYQVDPAHQLQTALFTDASLDAATTDDFITAAQINRELAHLGRALTQLTSTEVRYLPSIDVGDLAVPLGVPVWLPGAGDDPYLTDVRADGTAQDVVLGFFLDDAGEHYLAVQNPNHDGGTFPTDRTDAARINLVFRFPPGDVVDHTQIHTLSAVSGDVEALPLIPDQQGTSTLQLTLNAGDMVLLKYVTAVPFALQD